MSAFPESVIEAATKNRSTGRGSAGTKFSPDPGSERKKPRHGGRRRTIPGSPYHQAIAAPRREGLRFADSIGAFGILFIVAFVASGTPWDRVGSFLQMRISVRNVVLLAVLLTAWPAAFSIAGLYEQASTAAGRHASALLRVAGATAVGAIVVLLFVLTDAESFGFGAVLAFWIATTLWSLLIRLMPESHHRFMPLPGPRRILIVGTGPRATQVIKQLRNDGRGPFELVGFVDSAEYGLTAVAPQQLLGAVPELEAILMRQPVDEVFIALPVRSCYGMIQDAIESCERVGVQSTHLADVFQSTYARAQIERSGEQAVVTMKVAPDDARLVVKRAIDIFGASVGLILLSPVFAAVAIAVKLTSRGPVFFEQQRYGFRRHLFPMLKFRTMVTNAEALQAGLEELNEATGPVFKIKHDPRITSIGRFLRRTSLDELPQLVNVLKGDMSLVGPRPLPLRDVHRFDEAWLLRRFSVRPGMTCLWQISGRSDLGFGAWVDLDLKYIDRWSLALDARILLRTLPAVLRGSGAS